MNYSLKELQKFLLRGHKKNPIEVLRVIKYFSSFNDKKILIERINKGVLPGKKTLYQGSRCNNLADLATNKYIPYYRPAEIEKEFEWIIFKIKYFSKDLGKYLELKEHYTEAFLSGEYEKALAILNDINENTLSFWAIEQELLCLELKNGFEANNEKLSALAQQTDKPLALLLMQFSSDRVNTLNSFNTFQHKLQNYIQSMGKSFSDDIIRSFINFYYLEDYSVIGSEEAKMILSFLDILSFIDIYEGVIKLISQLTTYNRIDLKKLDYILNLFPNEIKDFRVNNLKYLYLNRPITQELNKKEYIKTAKIIESYTANKYSEVFKLVSHLTAEYPIRFSIIDILVKNSLYISCETEDYLVTKNMWLRNLSKHMKNVYISKDKDKNINEIKNISKLFQGIGMNLEILAFCMEQSGIEDDHDKIQKLATIYSAILTPLKTNFSTNCFLKEYFNSVGFIESLSLIDNKELSGESFRNLFYKAQNLKNNAPAEAITILNGLKIRYNDFTKDSNIYEYERLVRELFYLHLNNNNNLKEALDLFIECYFINKDLITRLNGNKLLEEIKNNQFISLNLFKIAILKYILNPSDSYELYVALNNIGMQYNIRVMSEFLNEATFNINVLNEDKRLLFYILENIYKNDVMKHFVYLMPQKRNDERISVLNYLINENYGDVKSKKSEIEEINKFESVQKRIKQIDQKKIFVDTDAILNEMQEVYLNRFKYYLALDKLDLNLTYYDTNVLNSFIDFDKDIQMEFKSNPKKKIRFILFKEIVLDYFKELTLNKKFGLEKFLSSRIRHGVLESTLTNTLNHYKLLSLKDDSNGQKELVNLFRVKEIDKLNVTENGYEILQYLNDFSENIIEIIEGATNWIKVKTLEHQTGLFDYSIYENDQVLKYIYPDFNDIKNFKIFYSKLTDIFWGHTESLLKDIKDIINRKLYDMFKKELITLEENLRSIIVADENEERLIGHICKDIRNAIANFHKDLAEVCNWMIIRKSNEFHDFEFIELIETSLEIVNKGNVQLNSKEKIDLKLKVAGKYFEYFIDIVTMLYTNAMKHSGFNDLRELKIETCVCILNVEELWGNIGFEEVDYGVNKDKMWELFENSKGPIVKILVKNNLSPIVDKQKITHKIKDRFKIISQKEVPEEMILGEGGTGILKIYSILQYNIGAPFVNFYSVKDNQMHAELIIDFSNLEV